MKSTFHKWVLNVMTAPDPTPMNKSHKYNVKTQKIEMGPELGIRGGREIALAIDCLLSACGFNHGTSALGKRLRGCLAFLALALALAYRQ